MVARWNEDKHELESDARLLAVGGPHDGKMIEVSAFQMDKGFIRLSSSQPYTKLDDGTIKMFVYTIEGNQLIFKE